MSFIGAKPTAVPLTGSDITDGIITSAKITDGTIATSDISDGAVTSVKTTGVGGANTPIFYGELASHQTISRNAQVKITGMTDDEQDTASAFDGTTFTVPSGQGGKYFLFGTVVYDFELAGDDGWQVEIALYKNGSSIKDAKFRNGASGERYLRYVTIDISGIFTLSASNTLELYTQSMDSSGNDARVLNAKTSFGGYKLVE